VRLPIPPLSEKDVALELARKLALRLETEYRVTLTRSDDYQLPLPQRAAIANQAKADLFISLHTGASYHHSARGMTVYYHAPIANLKGADAAQQEHDTALTRWSRIQDRHTAASRRLAAALQNALTGLGDAYACRILPAPLPLLEGADMPAVLVEVGPITNPTAESSILSDQGLNRVGAWRSLVAHLLWEQGAGGSNPLAPTSKTKNLCKSCSSIKFNISRAIVLQKQFWK
jgi:N-acetylmuramoyl-L-alanine amidase